MLPSAFKTGCSCGLVLLASMVKDEESWEFLEWPGRKPSHQPECVFVLLTLMLQPEPDLPVRALLPGQWQVRVLVFYTAASNNYMFLNILVFTLTPAHLLPPAITGITLKLNSQSLFFWRSLPSFWPLLSSVMSLTKLVRILWAGLWPSHEHLYSD